jgi:hypothetical protein
MRRAWLLPGLVSALGTGPASAFVVQGLTDFNPAARTQLATFFDAANALLPPAIQEATASTPVRFGRLSGDTRFLPPPRPGFNSTTHTQLLGLTNRHGITLDATLTGEILAGPQGSQRFGWAHGTGYRTALATLLHELAHAWERTTHDPVSSREDFRELVGFVGHRPRQRLVEGAASLRRSPDPYEFRAPAEAFAVNMEYFLLDPDFACRRPLLHRYLARQFGDAFATTRHCQLDTRLPLWDGLRAHWVDLNPDRVWQVQYLLADQGAGMAARFGHAMLRIVLCAPARTKTNEECLSDASTHLVVSYRARLDFGQGLNPLKGLRGKYPLHGDIESLATTVRRYTRVEQRQLTAYPLRLTPEAQRDLILRIIEEFWTYEGSYAFLNRNCATETQRLLSVALPQEEAFPRARSPRGVRQSLEEMGLIDPNATPDPRNVFPSARPHLEESVRELVAADVLPAGSTLTTYLAQAPAARRQALLASQQLAEPLAHRRALVQLLELESVPQQRDRDEAGKQMMAWLGDTCAKAADRAVEPELCATLESLAALSGKLNGWSLVREDAGYGVPFTSERFANVEFTGNLSLANLPSQLRAGFASAPRDRRENEVRMAIITWKASTALIQELTEALRQTLLPRTPQP